MIFFILVSAVSETISDIDSTLAQLDSDADEDAITKFSNIKDILASDLFGRRRKRSDESKINFFLDTYSLSKNPHVGCQTELTKWTKVKTDFQDSLSILNTINSTNPLVIELRAKLNSFFTSKMSLINGEIRYFIINLS